MPDPLRQKLIRLAHAVPTLRATLVPILRQAARDVLAVKIKDFQRMLSMPGEFGILSAYGDKSISVNKDRQTDLMKDLQAKGYSFDHLKGVWEGKAEQSLLVKGMKASDLFALGREYNQISVIHKNKAGVLGMYYLRENTVEVAVKPDASIAAEIAKGNDLYSKSRGNSFLINFLWGQRLPWDGHSSIDKGQIIKWIHDGKIDFTPPKPEDPPAPPEHEPDHTDTTNPFGKQWNNMTWERQQAYCKLHPTSRFCRGRSPDAHAP